MARHHSPAASAPASKRRSHGHQAGVVVDAGERRPHLGRRRVHPVSPLRQDAHTPHLTASGRRRVGTEGQGRWQTRLGAGAAGGGQQGRRPAMPTTIGFNHVATVTADADRLVAFYAKAFGAEVTFEMAEEEGHPRLVILDLGGGAALNVFEQSGDDVLIGDRRRPGGRGAIDHFGLAVDSLASLEEVRDRLVGPGGRHRRDPAARLRVVAVLPRPRRHGARGVLRAGRGRPRGRARPARRRGVAAGQRVGPRPARDWSRAARRGLTASPCMRRVRTPSGPCGPCLHAAGCPRSGRPWP